ncbi:MULTISPECIES: hypothetical protein [unclassified Streptomyces]|uniref:hypothetical protein n=1 Tax=unclassified Streptomyces TaxID=2593676 RepID=UPI0036F05F50
MSELTPLDRAEAAVRDAETNSAAVQVALAAVDLAKTAAAQQQPHHCQHHTPQQQFDARKWWTIGGLVIVGAGAVSMLALAFAVAMTAIAVGACCATCCLLILRALWRDIRNGR